MIGTILLLAVAVAGLAAGSPTSCSTGLNRLVAALRAVVLTGGSAALLRWSDSLALTYACIAVGVVVFVVVGVLLKRREDRARTPGSTEQPPLYAAMGARICR